MFEFFRALFGTDFMPHLYCLRSDPAVLWLQVIADLGIAAAYFAIPLVLFDVVLKRRDLLFRRVAILSVVFIAACGTTHLLSVWTIWVPIYRFEAVVKAATAVASVTTAIVLVRIRPLIYGLPSISDLEHEIRLRERAEAEARGKEVRFRAFVDSVEDYAIYMLSPQGLVLSWNSGAQRMLGYCAEEVVGKSFSAFYPDEDRALDRPEEILRMAREAGGFQEEGWRVRKDGGQFLATIHLRPLYESGDLLGFSNVTRDLTESREIEEKYRKLLEAAPDAIVIVREDGRVDFMNAQSEKLFGYDRSEVVGEPVDMLVPPQAREAQAGYVEELFEDSSAPLAPVPPEIFGMRKDGSSFSLEFTVNPLETRDGRLLVFSIRDLTERNRTQAQFRALLEAVPDAIVMMAPTDRITYVNCRAEELFGFSRMDLLGQSPDILVAPQCCAEDRERRQRFLAQPALVTEDMRWEQVCVRSDGSEFPVEVRVNPLETIEGTVLMASVRDLTERKKTESRFQALLEAVPDAIVVHRMPDEIGYINSKAEALFGWSRQELLGRSSDILIPERMRAARRAARQELFRTLFSTGVSRNGEYLCVDREGREFEVEASVSPLETPEGPVILASIRDMTERRKMEARFRAVLQAVPDGIVLMDAKGCIQFMNRQAEKMYGYASEELLGVVGDILVPLRLREARRQYGGRMIAKDDVHRASEVGSESVGLRKDGSEFPTESSFSPLETSEGRMLLFAIRDVTERRKSEARFRALLDSAPDAMVISDREGIIELANRQAERIFGYSREEMVGQSVGILIPQELHSDYGRDEEAFLSGDHGRTMGAGLDLRARRKDGSEFPVEISFSPLEGPSGISMTAAIRDITERKLVAQQLAEKMAELRQSNEALEQFAHIASHDLQEPLRMVASYTQLLAKRYTGRLDADADEFIHFAVDGTQRMKRLIEDLLLYSRAGRGGPAATEVRGEDAVQEAVGNLRAAIGDSGAQVTCEALPVVSVVELHLVQIFQNLIGNAIKYRGDRVPRIHIAAREGESEWVFSVADNGIGIEPKYFDRVFVIFQRLHGRGEYEGTGIGLAICKRILHQQGGRIWVESEPGVGSTFYFALPMR
jgi:PAS domain S-box-containing protein